MEKVNFIYIGKNEIRNIPQKEFFALKLSKSDKQKLYPHLSDDDLKKLNVLCPQTNTYGKSDEVFINGIGYRKFGKTNKIVVPVFSGDIEDWDSYLEKYGKECLYYSLTGESLYSGDCCFYNIRNEFLSILQCEGGIKKYQKYVENMEEIQRIQTKVFNEKLSFMYDWERKNFIEKNLFRPYFNYFFITISPFLDTPNDDIKMEKFYRTYRSYEIKISHPDYEKLLEARKRVDSRSYSMPNDEYKKIGDEYTAIQKRINDTIIETLQKEIECDNGVFPACMSDRMKMLFGEKCHTLYNYILNHFN